MENKKEKYIFIDFKENGEEIHIEGNRSISENSLMEKILKKESRIAAIPAEVMEKNITETIQNFVHILDKVNENSETFDIDEVEFGLTVGCDGAIRIASLLNGGANAQTTVKIKMKKKEEKSGENT